MPSNRKTDDRWPQVVPRAIDKQESQHDSKEMEIKIISKDQISLVRLAQTKTLVAPVTGDNVG